VSDPFIGEIKIVGFNFAPRGWAFCNGQILSIAQNTALFSLLGTTYGGNGQTTFALPDLRGRVPIHPGQGPGLSNYTQGQLAGSETVTLLSTQMPAHTHTVNASTQSDITGNPTSNFPAGGASYDTTANTTMDPAMIGNSGGNQPHSNLQPYLAINFCIALEGIFPSRN
jgi:microcystin-dependent protein